MVLIPPLSKRAEKFSLIDLPNPRKVHARPVPRVGGVAMLVGAILPILVWAPHTRMVISYVLGVLVLGGFSLWDDRRDLNYRLKFLGQFLAIIIVVVGGGLSIQIFPSGDSTFIAHWVALPLTVFALLGITNAINLADGLDGLAAGVTFISLIAIAVLAQMGENAVVLLMALAVLGCLVGFLRFNTHPAIIFMGDSGSQFLGFSLGIFVILAVGHGESRLSLGAPLLLLGVPILDTLTVMFQRVRAGVSPFRADKNHLHHKLLALGLDHYEAVLCIYVVQALMVCAGVLLRDQPTWGNLLAFGAIILLSLLVLRHLTARPIRAQPRPPGAGVSRLGALLGRLQHTDVFSRYPLGLLSAAVPLYLVWASFHIQALPEFPQAIGYCLWALSLILWYRLRANPSFHVLERLVLCAGISAIVYHAALNGRYSESASVGEYWFLLTLIVAIILAYCFSKPRLFTLTTLDFLILFAVLGLPTLLGDGIANANLGQIAVKSVILYYALELIILQMAARAFWIRGGSVVVLSAFLGHVIQS